MSIASYVRRHVNLLAERQVFSTRDLLEYGDRDLIDHALSDLVKKERILWLAVGLYMVGDEATPRPTLAEVMIAKGEALGWDLYIDECNQEKLNYVAASRKDTTANSMCEVTFYITGHSTSFKYGNIRILVKAISPRKLKELKENNKLIEVNYFASRSGSSASTRSANFFNRLKE